MRSCIVMETQTERGVQPVFTGVGKHIRYYQFESERGEPDRNCTLKTLWKHIRSTGHATGTPLTTLKLSLEAFSSIANETYPPMTKTEIEAALSLKVELV